MTLSADGQTHPIQTSADLVLGGGGFLDIARAVLTALEVVPGGTAPFHLVAETEIPQSAGLGGHTALLAAATGCVLTHLGLRLGPYEVAELIRKIDADILGTPFGFQDHYMAVFGGLNFLDFRDKDSRRPQEPPAPFAAVEALESYTGDLPMLLAYSPETVRTDADLESLRQRWQAGDAGVVEGITEIAQLARRGKRALLAGDWDVLAAFMDHNHTILRDLTETDADEIALVNALLDGGALGAKRAGPDGSAILALTTDRERTLQACQDIGVAVLHAPAPGPGLTVSIEVTV